MESQEMSEKEDDSKESVVESLSSPAEEEDGSSTLSSRRSSVSSDPGDNYDIEESKSSGKLIRKAFSSSSSSDEFSADENEEDDLDRGKSENVEYSNEEDEKFRTSSSEEVDEPNPIEEPTNPDGNGQDPGPSNEEQESQNILDFDMMMEQKRQEKRRYRKRRDIDLINDNDDAIAKLIADMRQSLPHIQIRTELLKYLKRVRIDDISRLKESGIGKAVMYLYRHPRETRSNKDLAGKIINQWARPIFNVCTDYSTMSKEDRQQRDEEMAAKLALNKRPRIVQAVKARRASMTDPTTSQEATSLRPGDPGWIPRARVPMPDNKEFVVRPQWQSNEDLSTLRGKKSVSLLEKHKRKFAEKRKMYRMQHAVKISLEGRKLNL